MLGPGRDVKDSRVVAALNSSTTACLLGGGRQEGSKSGMQVTGPVVPAEFLRASRTRHTSPQPPFLSGLSWGGTPLHIASAPAKHEPQEKLRGGCDPNGLAG